jgi:hypothetical protein
LVHCFLKWFTAEARAISLRWLVNLLQCPGVKAVKARFHYYSLLSYLKLCKEDGTLHAVKLPLSFFHNSLKPDYSLAHFDAPRFSVT